MHADLSDDERDHEPVISTGELPSGERVRTLLIEAHARYRTVTDGHVADYIPALAKASPDLFGLAVAGVRGRTFAVGDHDAEFSIQSVSKPFVFALVCDAIGYDEARKRIGVNSSGLPFNSIMAIELNDDRTVNPLVNAGAIATTSLTPGETADEKWAFVLAGLSAFAGRQLELDDDVYASESASNTRNEGIAQLLDSYERIYFDPIAATDVYTKQCSIRVNVTDLAVMAATLADGGVNPLTGIRVVSADTCKRVLAVLATAGLYEHSGEWMYDIGLPGKSGVSGGIITIAPGKGGVASYSPPLDEAGNSVRGQLASKFLSDLLGLNLFASAPAERVAEPGVSTLTAAELSGSAAAS
ncbi:MAG: glutaminase [Subtercola sp.]|nr:glutaminase [Subtercola sp.]